MFAVKKLMPTNGCSLLNVIIDKVRNGRDRQQRKFKRRRRPANRRNQDEATGGLERLQAGTLKGTQVAQVARMRIVEQRVHGRQATAREEAREQVKVAKATAGHDGLVLKQDTLQHRVQKAATRTCLQ